jgi:hypothetical protein
MLRDYLKTFLLIAFVDLFGLAFIALLILIFTKENARIYSSYLPLLRTTIAVFLMITSYQTHRAVLRRLQRSEREASRLQELAAKDAEVWRATTLERSAGFPTLMSAIKEYDRARDEVVTNSLIERARPAKKTGEIVKEQTARRREAEFNAKTALALIDYYESIAPFLLDLKNDLVDAKGDEDIFGDYDEEEQRDPVTNYLTKEEFRKLSAVERNQLALDRFWKRPKSKRLLGRLYERYIGYLYEKDGYDVEYLGIFNGLEDLGRDLVCRKQNDSIVIQCKNWSHFKTVYEKHIFQFFGTVFQYRHSYPSRKVMAIFYTTTRLSDLARRFANELGIELKENLKFDQSYPCIKCNVDLATKEKIYHLPFDQKYDDTKIVNAGEFYCSTVKQAEQAGFRRALRWRGGIPLRQAQAQR